MTLRTQLLALFAALAVIPLLAIGVIDYVRSIRALEDVVAAQTAQVASQTAAAVADEYTSVAANLALLAEHAEAGALLSPTAAGANDSSASAYLGQLWEAVRRDVARVDYLDRSGVVRVTLVDANGGPALRRGDVARYYPLSIPMHDAQHAVIGRVNVILRLDSLLARVSLDATFGRSGRSALVDTAIGDVVRAGTGSGMLPLVAWAAAARGDSSSHTRRVRYVEADSAHVGTLALIAGTPFAILSVGNVDEFSGAFGRIRSGNLAIVFLTTALVATLFVVLLWRATRSLIILTEAADEVGRGNLAPRLPAPRADEVGRLSAAFALMLTRVRESLNQMERSRQLAAVGEFAAQVSHEIRNPLTAIKLNLQTLERAARDGGVRPELAAPVAISLREIQRLERVVRGVLQLGRVRDTPMTVVSLDDVARCAIDTLQPTCEQQGIALELELPAAAVTVRADRALIDAACLNLLMNAVEALPSGGHIRVVVSRDLRDGRATGRIVIEDDGPGISSTDRERVFTPFYSTKADGTGLGLALAHRTAEEHGGHLWIGDGPDGTRGAMFILELPLTAGIA